MLIKWRYHQINRSHMSALSWLVRNSALQIIDQVDKADQADQMDQLDTGSLCYYHYY